jgi:hypothetical protein
MQEPLRNPGRGVIILERAAPQLKLRTKQRRERLHRMAFHREATAPGRPARPECGLDHVPSRRERVAKNLHVAPLFELPHQDMQDGTIMADRVPAQWAEGRDVGGDPRHTLGSRPQAILRLGQCRRRKVKYRKIRPQRSWSSGDYGFSARSTTV